MAHADDDGLVLPPRIAQTHVVIIPITPKAETRAAVVSAADNLAAALRDVRYAGSPIEVEVDRRDLGGGVKNWEWIKKGVPIRVEMGPRDLESGSIAVSRRDQPVKAKAFVAAADFPVAVAGLLEAIQLSLLDRAKQFRDENTRVVERKEEFYDFFTAKNSEKPEIHGGFALAHWSGSRQIEEQVKRDLKVTIRCIPFVDGSGQPNESGTCIFSGAPSPQRVVWAKSY